MSVSVNRVILAGNLTWDPQVRVLAHERAVARFGLAISNRFRTEDGLQREDTVFVDIEAWGRTAEMVGQYLTKGRSCLVEGRLRLDVWEKDGQKHSRFKVVADQVQFLDRGSGGGAGVGATPAPTAIVEAAREGAPAHAPSAAGMRPAVPLALREEPPF